MASAAAGAGSRSRAISHPDLIALDCEMIGNTKKKSHSYLAHVGIVDAEGNILMNDYVRPPTFIPVKNLNFRTKHSGVNETYLAGPTISFPEARAKVLGLMEGKTIVGHALNNDFIALKIDPKTLPNKILDTAEIPVFQQLIGERLQSQSLKTLALGLLKKEIQTEKHNAIEDAQTAMELIIKYERHLDTPKEVVIARIKEMNAAKAAKNGGTRKRRRAAAGTRRRR